MNIRIYYILAAALFTLGLLVGCKGLTQVEATKSAGDETRTLISENVADEAKAKQMIALVDPCRICITPITGTHGPSV